MTEILAPAGNVKCAEAAINNGADAVYLGLTSFSARQGAENFDEEGFCAFVQWAHFCGAKIYVAMNTLIKDSELDGFFQNVLFAWNNGADAIILQDEFLGKYIHEQYPEIILHLSTQAGVCNLDGAKFAKSCGFSRVILARETPLAEIKKITEIIETEVFVQGALCTCFSGQCYFSSFAGGNSGNRGRCKQPCRKQYSYNRNGNTEKNYALSLSDLCVGEDIQKLIDAGVCSFKIEGRMRRAEYVAAAVRYYRGLLDSTNSAIDLSDLKRTYNRGNYTKGLAFGQDKRFLSVDIQGHIGEKVGVVKVVNGKYVVESRFSPKIGDAFKILREGKEVGGAVYGTAVNRGFSLSSKSRLRNGDGVFVTTDHTVNERVLSAEKIREIHLSLHFTEGEKAVVCGEGITVVSEEILQSANSRALSAEELISCFLKTDGLPAKVSFDDIQITGNIFIAKSQLNALRRAFYSSLLQGATSRQVAYKSIEIDLPQGKNEKTAVIADDFEGIKTDVAVFKPKDFQAALPKNFLEGDFEKYLYYPAFCTSEDRSALDRMLSEGAIDGVYAENYGGIVFAQERGLKIFGGTGLNLFNSLSVKGFLATENVEYFAISKELNEGESRRLVCEKTFVLTAGNIKIMDLCYCPFGKTCAKCDKKDVYTLTDEHGRVFPVRRYLAADGACRFEVYNCVDLVGEGLKEAGRMYELTMTKEKAKVLSAQSAEAQKAVYGSYTSGHFKRGIL